MCHGPRTNPLHFGDAPNYDPDPDYDPDRTDLHDIFPRDMFRAKEQSINFCGGLEYLNDV